MGRARSVMDTAGGPSWKLRRRAVFGTLIFSAFIVVYVALRWDDLRIAETLALGAFGLMGTVVAAYIGGAVYEDTRLHQPERMGNQEEC